MTPMAVVYWGTGFAQGVLALSMMLCAWRAFVGPRAQDRVLGLDTLYVNAMLLVMVHCIRTALGAYFEMSLILAVIGFTSTVALAKFLMRGEVIE